MPETISDDLILSLYGMDDFTYRVLRSICDNVRFLLPPGETFCCRRGGEEKDYEPICSGAHIYTLRDTKGRLVGTAEVDEVFHNFYYTTNVNYPNEKN